MSNLNNLINLHNFKLKNLKEEQNEEATSFNLNPNEEQKQKLVKVSEGLKEEKENKDSYISTVFEYQNIQEEIDRLKKNLIYIHKNNIMEHESLLLKHVMKGGYIKENSLKPSWIEDCTLVSKEQSIDILNKIKINEYIPEQENELTENIKLDVEITPNLEDSIEQEELDAFAHLRKNRYNYNITIDYNENLIKEVIKQEDLSNIIIEYFKGDEDSRRRIIDDYGEIEYWNITNIKNADNLFKELTLDKNLSYWQPNNLETSNFMFEKTNFTGEMDFLQKKVTIKIDTPEFNALPVEEKDSIVKQLEEKRKCKVNRNQDGTLYEIYFNCWNIENLKSAYGMFSNSNFNGEIGNWNPKNLEDVSYMFAGCTHFNKPIYFSTNKIKKAEYMFAGSVFNNYVSLHLNSNIDNLESMEGMFSNNYIFNKKISGNGNSNIFHAHKKIRKKYKKLVNLSKMFENAISFNQDFTNINLYTIVPNQLILENFLSNAINFKNLESLSKISVREHSILTENMLKGVKNYNNLDNEIFKTIILDPKLFVGIENRLEELLQEKLKLDILFQNHVDAFNFNNIPFFVKYNSNEFEFRQTPSYKIYDKFKKDRKLIEDPYRSIYKSIDTEVLKKWNFNQIEFNQITLKEKTLTYRGEDKKWYSNNKDEINKILKYAFKLHVDETTEPHYQLVLYYAVKYIYLKKNLGINENEIFPRENWEYKLVSYTNRYQGKLRDKHKPVVNLKEIIDLKENGEYVCKNFEELINCAIFYLHCINIDRLTFNDILKKNNKLKELAFNNDDNYLKNYDDLLKIFKHKYIAAGFIIGSYFLHITEKTPLPKVFEQEIQYNNRRNKLNALSKRKNDNLKSINEKGERGPRHNKYDKIVNTFEFFLNQGNQDVEYPFTDDCADTEFPVKDSKITSTDVDDDWANKTLDFYKNVKQYYLSKCSAFYIKGMSSDVKIPNDDNSNILTLFKEVVDNIGQYHNINFDKTTLKQEDINVDKREFKKKIKQKVNTLPSQYFNCTFSDGTARSFNIKPCCIIIYEIPYGTPGIFPSFSVQNNKTFGPVEYIKTGFGESEILLHPLIQYEITKIKYGILDETDDIGFIKLDESRDSKKYIIHLKAVGLIDSSRLEQVKKFSLGSIIKVPKSVLQKNNCGSYDDINSLPDDQLLFKIKSYTKDDFFEEIQYCICQRVNQEGDQYRELPDTEKISNIKIERDNQCDIIVESTRTTQKSLSIFDNGSLSNNLFTLNCTGFSEIMRDTFILPDDVWVLIPHWKGLEQNYILNGNLTSSFESVLYDLNGKDKRFSGNVFSFSHGFKLYKNTSLPKNIKFNRTDLELNCNELVKLGDKMRKSLTNCKKGLCMIPVLQEKGGKFDHVVKENKTKYRFKICNSNYVYLTDIVEQLKEFNDPNYNNIKIFFPLTSNYGCNNIEISPVPHNNTSWNDIFSVLLESEDNCIKPDHPLFN